MKNYNKINATLVVFMIISNALSSIYLPSFIPIHYTDGVIDTYGSKYLNYILLILLVVLCVALPYIEKQYCKNPRNNLTKFRVCFTTFYIFMTIIDTYFVMKALQYTGLGISNNDYMNSFICFIFVLLAIFIIFLEDRIKIKLNCSILYAKNPKNSIIKKLIICMGFVFIGFGLLIFHFSFVISVGMLLLPLLSFIMCYIKGRNIA